jgi:AcrR family transcriptional regulator
MTTESNLPLRSQRGARGQYAKSAQRRREILAAALEVFAGVGYNNGSLRAVAQRCGVPETTVLHHFSSKKVLLEVLLDDQEQSAREVAELHTDLFGALEAVLETNDEASARFAELMNRLSVEATDPDHPAHAHLVRRSRRLQAALTDGFADIRKTGRLRTGVSPSTAAALVLAAWGGLENRHLLDPDAPDVPDTTTGLRTLLSAFVIDDPHEKENDHAVD